MQKAKVFQQLNSIAELFELGFPIGDADVCRTFGANLDYPLTLVGENREKFDYAIDALLESLPTLTDTISKAFLVDQLIPLIREKKVREETFTPADANQLERNIRDLPVQRYKVLRPIVGVDIAPDQTPVEFGDFKIEFGRKLLATDSDDSLLRREMNAAQENQLFIQCGVPARESNHATERADELFYRFELIFRLLIGTRTNWVEVGILNYTGAQMRIQFVYSESGRPVGSGSSWHGALQPYLLKDARFPQPTPPFVRLFELITRPNTDLEKHILRCAEWTGQAIAEPNEAAALVKAAIALEVLFSSNERGVITPSIMAQISESCAFLLGSDAESALNVEREVKRLYGIRSSVVHSGKDSVDPKDLGAFIRICRRVVVQLLSHDELTRLGSMDELAGILRLKKYGAIR
jgi:hypothetical protein